MIISFQEFIKADEEWDNYDAACSTYHEAAQYSNQRQDKYVYEWMKWNSCKGALEHFNMDLNNSGDMSFTGLNHEICGEWIADGAETFENRMAAALVLAGKAAEEWIENKNLYERNVVYREARQQLLLKMYENHKKSEERKEKDQ
tara:strand:- start:263 stop:697 length:435 start_codon:yes stop_codon:yes gene_type:complete